MNTQPSQNPFFSQDSILPQSLAIDLRIQDEQPSSNESTIDFNLWVNEVMKKFCCTKECLKKLEKKNCFNSKLNFIDFKKSTRVGSSIFQSYRTQRAGNQREYLDY